MTTQAYTIVLIILLTITSNFHYTSAVCDLTKGCFPGIFDVLDKIATFPARSITASSVCGKLAPEKYMSFLESDFKVYDCAPASLSESNMADGNSQTYWQSSVGDSPQFVEVRFTDKFQIYEMLVKFNVPHMTDTSKSADARPLAWSVEKLANDGTTWVTLRHFAKDCATSFPGVGLLDPFGENKYNVVSCAQYATVDANADFQDASNRITYYPGRLDVFAPFSFRNDPLVAEYFTTTGIRLSFVNQNRVVSQQRYVSISSIIMDVRCQCNGHAEVCSGPNLATCACQHSTTGQYCESCLPLYNNLTWTHGDNTNAGACQKCSCNNHASSCVYDAAKKHGVCQNCQDRTAGDFCNTCATGHYINSSWASSGDVDKGGAYCLPCQCNAAGTSSSELSVCVTETGQCSCKVNVQGRDCSECKDTYFGLSASNALGCAACSCNPSGTIGDNSMCDKTSGACLCRPNVGGVSCDTCKVNTYGFNANNPDGCNACACDPGASLGQTCNVLTGQCNCRANIGNRDCSVPQGGTFVPRLDLIILEPKAANPQDEVLRAGHGTAGATSSGRGLVEITSAKNILVTFTADYGGLMDLAVRYEKTTQNNLVFLQYTLTLTSSQSYSCGAITVNVGQTWKESQTKIDESKTGALQFAQVCLAKGATYSLELTNSGPVLLVDSIVFVPEKESLKTPVAGLINSAEIDTCHKNAFSILRQNRNACKDLEYSLIAAFLNGAQTCSCTGGSLNSAVCDAYSGDCDCKTGVLPPTCSECLVETYQFSIQTGCIACGCHPKGSVNTFCDTQGGCKCHPNVQGNKCDSCALNHFGLHTGQGCTPCQCNPTYSVGANCNDLGQCNCKPGVGGTNCDKCADGHFNLTPNGCTACACNVKGSTGVGCNQATGVCQCRDNVEGTACDTCKTGFFGLGDWHTGGCIPCFCWSKGSSCSSAPSLYDNSITTMSTMWPDSWTAVDSAGSPLTVMVEGSGAEQKLKISPLVEAGANLYFMAPVKYQGDWSSSYGRALSLVLSSTVLPSNTNPAEGSTKADIMVEGTYASKALKYSATLQLNSPKQNMKISIDEASWQVIDKGTQAQDGQVLPTATFTQLMQVLTSVSAFKIQAYSSKTPGYASMLHSVTLEAGSSGPTTSVSVNNVEMCQCQEGYGGKHCEVCAAGFTRTIPNNQDPSGLCVACNCNKHAKKVCDNAGVCSGDVPCNPVTGVCECIHNTEGDRCETCKTGYYGNPTKGTPDDCLPCACPGIVVENDVNVFASTCAQNVAGAPVCSGCATGHSGDHCEICINGYYGTPENATNAGGKCQPCVCNGRADTCDTKTGVCTNCQSNTAGQQCDICAPGYFGDAMTLTCQECVCKSYPGSTGNCDPKTGHCECLPNVEGTLCDQCTDTTYNLQPKIGCQACECHENGSVSLICDKATGKCNCRNLVQGRQCNQCQDSYWNINQVTGCDACACNALGTKKNGEAIIATCDLVTGQCECALPGTTGRTCDACSPVTTYKLSYIQLFYLGSFPQCELCGECFDSWGLTIDAIGKETDALNNQSKAIWQQFDNQTPEQIGTSLSLTEEKIKKAAESVGSFEDLAQDLVELQNRLGQATTKNGVLGSRINLLSTREKALTDQLAIIEALTKVIKLTESTTTSVTILQQGMNTLMTNAQNSNKLGVASWNSIQTLAFVVADPAEKERQLLQQAQASMQIANLADQTYQLADIMYKNNLKPGSEDSARDLAGATKQQTEASTKLTSVQTSASQVTANIASIKTALSSLVDASKKSRTDTLKMVNDLETYVTSASAAQRNADDAQENADKFMTEAKQAETTMRNSMSTILENLASLTKAETDLVSSQSQSTKVLGITLRPNSDLQVIMANIKSTPVSSPDVQAVELKAQKALVLAEEALLDTQKALGLARDVNQGVVIMEEDITAAKNTRTEADGLKAAADIVKGEIDGVLKEVGEHIDTTKKGIESVTALSEEVLTNVTTINTCLDQGTVKVTEATKSADRAEERAQTTSQNQQVLLQLMLDINAESNDQTVTQALNSLTQGSSVLTQVTDGRKEVEAVTDIQALVQDLVSQMQVIDTLDSEINALTSELDNLVLSLQENLDGGACNV